MKQEEIGKRIASFRKQNNMTQEQLGEKLCVSGKTISKWERGISLPDITLIIELSNLLNVTVNELLIGKDNSSKKFKYNNKYIDIMVFLLIMILLFSTSIKKMVIILRFLK